MTKMEAATLISSSRPGQPGWAMEQDERPSLGGSQELPRGGLPLWRLRRTLDFIEANMAGEIRLQHLADAARLSPHHFSELFRQSTGVSPYRYVLDRRVERAKCLLRDSMMGVLDIALAVGFSDQSHFSKVFRRATGIAPGAYRTVQWAEGMPAFAMPEDQTNKRSNVLTLRR